MSAVPPVDLRLQHQAIADEIAQGFAAVVDKTAFILGPAVKEFETAYGVIVLIIVLFSGILPWAFSFFTARFGPSAWAMAPYIALARAM